MSSYYRRCSDFSGIAPITLSGDFSVEILTEVTPSWKTKSNKSISVMEDGISRWLHHRCEVCCEKGDCHGRQALVVDKEYTMEMYFPDKWT